MSAKGNLTNDLHQPAFPLFQPTSHTQRYLPEGIQCIGDGKISWVNIQNGPSATTGSISIYDLETRRIQTATVPSRIGFAFPTTDQDVFLVGAEDRIALFDIKRESWFSDICRIDNIAPDTIINDACMFELGLIIGTKDVDVKDPIAAIYYYSFQHRTLTRLLDGQTCSNGKVVIQSNGQWELYDIDSPQQRLMRYRLDLHSESPAILDSNVHIDLSDFGSYPDGMTITPDQESVVIAFYDPDPAASDGSARQFSIQTGQLEKTWTCSGAPRVTCPAFVSMDAKICLALTTAIESSGGAADQLLQRAPNSGAVFIAETEFHGPNNVCFFDITAHSLSVISNA